MYNGTITYQGNTITVQDAIGLGLITQDGNGDIWLSQDTNHLIKISGDLRLG